MRLVDLSLTTPEENLALDEALFELCEDSGAPSLRFWEPPRVFVVLGYTNHAAAEVHLQECRARKIPVLRRLSGGGTVVQAPGVLNYTIALPLSGPLSTITGTNRFILERQQRALAPLVEGELAIRGQTDLALDGRKVSGNAQKRGRRAILFHGTFLLGLDLTLLEALLPMPSRQPDYRGGRAHGEFLQNLGLDAARVKEALRSAWQATPERHSIEPGQLERLINRHYGNPEWNSRR
jgi:lipoate-protein ligase A